MEQYYPYLIVAGAIVAVVFFVRKKKNKPVVRKGQSGKVGGSRNTGKQQQK
jgi:hypothetical protein